MKIITVLLFGMVCAAPKSYIGDQTREHRRILHPKDLPSSLREIEQRLSKINSTLLSDNDRVQLILSLEDEDPEGFECTAQIVAEEKLEYIDEERCYQKPSQLCYMTKSVKFVPKDRKVCQTHFVEKCYITYAPKVDVRSIRKCEKKKVYECGLAKNTKINPKPQCRFEYKTVCSTEYVVKNITETHADCLDTIMDMTMDDNTVIHVPRQNCTLIPVVSQKTFPLPACKQIQSEVCAPPKDCDWVEKDICSDEDHSFVVNVPDQKCDLSPSEECYVVNEFVPTMTDSQECKDVSFEDCNLQASLPVSTTKDKIVKKCVVIMPVPPPGLLTPTEPGTVPTTIESETEPATTESGLTTPEATTVTATTPTVKPPGASDFFECPPSDASILDVIETGSLTVVTKGANKVPCLGNSIVVQRRVENDGTASDQTSDTYKTKGVGSLEAGKNFIVPLQLVHELTNQEGFNTLTIWMKLYNGTEQVVQYSDFKLGKSLEIKSIQFEGPEGAEPCLTKGTFFSTIDIDDDGRPGKKCTDEYGGGWWFKHGSAKEPFDKCGYCTLHGLNLDTYDENLAPQMSFWGPNKIQKSAMILSRPDALRSLPNFKSTAA